MAAFLSNQLDFIFFFYGLAFILLGATCLAVARSQGGGEAWAMLGGFGFVHGIGEWLDLAALIVGDTPAFLLTRTTLMVLSFMLLMDFARLKARRLAFTVPGRWIYVLLSLAVMIVGVAEGVVAAGIGARYAIGFVGAAGAGFMLAWQARTFSGEARSFAVAASVGFALYAVAAGLIVPAGHFWPASVINQGAFAASTGMPIQLVRGGLACWISFFVWAIWGERMTADMASPRYTAYVHRQFVWTLVAMGSILVSGWTLTEYLGGIYRQNVQKEARSDIDLLASRLAGETATIDGMVKALAGSPSVVPLLVRGNRENYDLARSVLDLDIEASGARHGYILDRSGTVVASSDGREALAVAPTYRSAPYFLKSIAGRPAYQFAFEPRDGTRDYLVSQPIRGGDGRIVGVAVLTKSLDGFAADLRQFDRPYFFINPDGLVMMTNRPEALHRLLWPLSKAKRSAYSRRFATLDDRPMLEKDIVDATWTNVDGERDYVRRRFAAHSDWSLVIMKPTHEIFATRFLGIVITLLVTIMALIYLLGRSRWVRDGVQSDKRLQLQELAQDMGIKATTDPLTGLHNRLKLDQAMVDETARAKRYESPLALVLFDIDHFKRVNDTFGHIAGDTVLIQLARFIPNLIRSNDLLARWGGEEFVILMPGCDGAMAYQAAEKLRAAISHVVFDEVGSITCSFGVAQHAAGEAVVEFIARADAALYQAKAGGRNQVKLQPFPTGGKPGLAAVA